jgi:hypothetical protein
MESSTTNTLTRLLDVKESVWLTASVLSERQQEPSPSESGVIQKTIHSIFARNRLSLGTFQKLKPIPMVKNEHKNKLKQVSAGESKFLSDSSFSKVFEDLEFVKGRSNFGWQLIIFGLMLYH